MLTRFRCLVLAMVASSMLVYVVGLRAQQPQQAQQAPPAPTYIPQTQFDSGQDIVPVYEGWIRNPDGTFDFVFGYFNRNFKEEIAIPAGPNNIVEPGGPDRGQPTYFLTRHQSRFFRTRVPKDWGQKVLTWSITANGRTEKAYADLRAVEEINEKIMQSGGNSLPFEPGNENPNQPPMITVGPVAAASISTPVTLTANVTDDGLPRPRAPQATPPPTVTDANGGRGRGQANAGGGGRGQANGGGAARGQANGAAPAARGQANGAGGGGGRGRGGPTVRWIQYGGPASVTFNPTGPAPVANGIAVVTVRFKAPGSYKLVAIANDGQLSSRADATVNVR